MPCHDILSVPGFLSNVPTSEVKQPPLDPLTSVLWPESSLSIYRSAFNLGTWYISPFLPIIITAVNCKIAFLRKQ